MDHATMEAKKKSKKKAPVKPVVKPYLTGKPTDKGTVKSAAMFFGSLIIMAVANLLLSAVLMWDNAFMRIAFNILMVLAIYAIFFQSGATKGTTAVGQGEIMYQRRENGKTVHQDDEASCYHPAKGFIIGLIGSIPLIVCAVMLAVMAKRQMTGLGALPSWLTVLERREEIGGALGYYHEYASMGLVDGLRLTVRMCVMPFINMVGSSNPDGLLTAERVSPLLAILPALAYGLGYTQGVKVRSKVHTDIALNKRKAAKKERKRRQARAPKGPEQLN